MDKIQYLQQKKQELRDKWKQGKGDSEILIRQAKLIDKALNLLGEKSMRSNS